MDLVFSESWIKPLPPPELRVESSLSTVLYANELGSGLGHLNRLVSVAALLPDSEAVFAVPDTSAAVPSVRRALGDRAAVRQGVFWPPPAGPDARDVATDTFADVLALFRFGARHLLERHVDQWISILDAVRPALIVADFAPALRIASRDRVPTVTVGNGFTVPPSGRLLPPMRPWQDAVPEQSRSVESTILETINAVRPSRTGDPFPFVADLFSSPTTFTSTIPEFDPYRAYRTAPTWRPFNVSPVQPGPPADQRLGPAIFVYMPSAHPLFDVLLAALNEVQVGIRVYVGDRSPDQVARACAPHIGVLRRPADFAEVIPRVSLIIHHAGLGTAYAGLRGGTPQLLFPRNLEHLITARSLVDAGVGQGYSAASKPGKDEVRRLVNLLLSDAGWMERARARARDFASRQQPDATGPILAACRAHLS